MEQSLLSEFFALFQGDGFITILRVLGITAPIWLPIFLGWVFWELWQRYIFASFLSNQKHILLEIKLPPEVRKTPQAAELMLVGLCQTSGETTFIDRNWYGKRRAWFGLEMASFGGEVHFFIWTRAFFRNMVETAIYSQYPGVEVHEVPDYASRIEYNEAKMNVWGTEFAFTKPDPYPIKTYIDYGMKEGTKEEEKIDPLTPLLEFLGSATTGNQVWVQFCIQSHKKDKKKPGTLFTKTTWRDEAEALKDTLLYRDPKTKGAKQRSETGFPILPSLSKSEMEVVGAIERSIGKTAFNVGIRIIYLSEKDKFNPVYIVGLLGCLRQFNSPDLNSFTPTHWHSDINYPWQDFNNIRHNRYARLIIEYYKRRAYFHHPYKKHAMVMTTEELATMYHFPGTVAVTPTMGRILAKKAEAPGNLPI